MANPKIKTIHLNHPDASGRIYCHRINEITEASLKHEKEYCLDCPYFYGRTDDGGLECEFFDGSMEYSMSFTDPGDSEKWAQYLLVRMGVTSSVDVDARLKGYSDMSPAELGVKGKK